MIRSLYSRAWVSSRCVRPVVQARRRRCLSSAPGAAAAAGDHLPVTHSDGGQQHDDSLLRQIFDSWTAWSSFRRPAQNTRNVGLFRNAFLTRPDGFLLYTQTSLRRAQQIVDRVLNASSLEEYRVVVRDLDRLSDLLCRVIDLCDFVRVTHPDRRTQQAASEAWSRMYQYMNELNTTRGLNDQLGVAMANPEVTKLWSEEEKAVAQILKLDFTKSAVALPQESRDRFVDLSQQISEVGAEFVNDVMPDHQYVSLPSSRFRGMDPVTAKGLTRGGILSLPSMSSEALLALRTVYDEDTRKALYFATRTASRRSVEVLESLVGLRSELAHLAGFESYGHMALRDRMMAKSPESVWQFLLALAKNNAPGVRQEMHTLLEENQKHKHSDATSFSPWNKEYYMESIRQSARSRQKHDASLPCYFSIGTVMQGLSRLFNRLYGIRFVPRETLTGETWHPDVRRLDVVSDTDGHVAVLYCDLFYRPDKSPNPAHFTVRCSREIPLSEIEEAGQHAGGTSESPAFGSPEEAANDGMALSRRDGVVKQLPTIVLLCDFAQSRADMPALLSFHQVETLFHEMGHAIHSVLARTSFQNVAGTRCATDLAELPSTLMEHFAADPSVLALFARHYATDEPLNYDLVADRLWESKRFEGSDDENQIILAMLDQECHSARAAQPAFDSTRIYHELQEAHGNLPADLPGTRWQGFFGHLFGYGSTYYSYLFDRVLAERVWKVVFSSGQGGGALSRENGEHLKESLLKWGGSKEPWRCVADALRDERVADGDEKAMALVGSWGTSSTIKGE